MASVNPLERGSLFPPELVRELVNKVSGHSALAKLSNERPIGFNGAKEMVFDMPNEMEIVGESGAKSHGGITVTPTTIIPIKFVYGARVSDEFMYAAEAERLETLRTFADGFAKKSAKALDLAAIHGVNPRTGSSSAVVNGNDFDHIVTSTVQATAQGSVAADLETAVLNVQAAGHDVTGIAMAPAFASAMGQVTGNGVPLYPQFQFGQTPDNFAGLGIDVNTTVGAVDSAIVGNFEDYFRWGFAKEVPVEVIRYGDPDNSGKDLRGYNQVYIRAEIYIGWGILDKTAFCRILPVASA